MTTYRRLRSKWYWVFFFLVLTFLFSSPSILLALGNIQVNLNDETVQDQAVTTRMNLESFSGSVSSSGDSSVQIDSFVFTFNEEGGSGTPEDSIDTLTLLYEGTERDTVNVDGSDSYALDLEENLPGNSAPEDFSVDLTMKRNPQHDADFDLHLDYIRYTEDPGGADNTKFEDENDSIDGPTTNVFTVKALVENYANVDGEKLTGILASESGDIPLVHMEFAGQNSSSNPVLGFEKVGFVLQRAAGNLVPGSPSSNTDYGDFRNIKLIRSDEEEFGEGNQETIATFGDLRDDSSPAYRMELSDLTGEDEDLFSETTDFSHYYLTISTNQGWGVEPDGDPSTQYFGYGDAWRAFLDGGSDTGSVEVVYNDEGDTATNADIGDTFFTIRPDYESLPNLFYHSLAPPLSITGKEVDRYFGKPTINQDDGIGLDFFPDALFGIVALGASDSGTVNTNLEEITLTFPETSDGFTPRTDLRDLTETKFSGLAVWHNESDYGNFGHGDDRLLKISASSSSWESDTVVHLKLQDGFELPSPSQAIGGIDEDLERNRGMLPGSVQPTVFITALFEKTGHYPDTFTARIPPSGLGFTDGQSVDPGLVFETDRKAQPVSVFFEQFPEESGENPMGAPDGPKPVLGLNTLDYADDGGTQARLDRIDVLFENTGDSFTTTDLNPLANSDTSGVSLWRDNSGHPDNKGGIFQPEVDKRVPLRLDSSSGCDGDTQYSCKGAPRGDFQDGFRVLLRVDHSATPQATVPADDSDTAAGSDYFVVVHTSSQGDNGDAFRASLGNPRIQDGPNPQISFIPESAAPNPTLPDDHFVSIFATGDTSATNRFFGQKFSVNTITALEINSLFSDPETISAGGQPKGLLGIRASDGENGDQTLEKIRVTFEDVANFDTTDLRPLRSGDQSGVQLYRDDGDDVFSSESDSLISLVDPEWEVYEDTFTVDLIPDETVEVPDSGSVNDFYVAVRASASIDLGDQFRAGIRGGDIQFNVEDSGKDVSETTPVTTASLPIIISDRTSSPYEKIDDPGEQFDVLGINAADQGNDEYLDSVKLKFHDVNQSDFERTDLKDRSTDMGSGIALWKDDNDNGAFEPGEDDFLVPNATPAFNGQDEVILEFTDNETQDTSIPETLDNQDDFFVVLRASSSMQHGDDFEVEIPSGGVETSNYSSGAGKGTNTIVRGSANIASLNFTDTDLMNDQVSATVRVSDQDTVEIRLAQDDDVYDLPPSQFERVEVREPDQPGGNHYTFNDLSVRVSSDTIGLVARGFNDTGPTDFSEREILRRRELAGIRLEGRDNVDLANALAADEDFGVVVFGQKGGSNTNTSDPAFAPPEESLKIIPPRGESATMRVFNLDQQMVYKRSGLPGEPIKWKGQGLGVDVVNNGAYVVKVKSGSEEKSFPVMVVK